MRSFCFGLIVLATSAAAYSQTVPLAPTLTAGAEFKGLRFDWTASAGATRYELEYKANQNASFAQLGGDLPASRTSFEYSFPLHLFDWTFARFRVAACNGTACTRSNEVSVSSLRRYAVGYFKAGESQAGIRFGSSTDATPDGLHFVTSATFDFNDTGGEPEEGGAVYVFSRGADRNWFQRARLLPTVSPLGSSIAMPVSISADGNTVAVGVPQYLHPDGSQGNSGEVFIFHFDGSAWSRSRLLSGTRGDFGRWVALNDAGDTLAVATGAIDRFVLIYRLIDGTWQPVRQFSAARVCNDGTLSGDGSTLAEPCHGSTSTGESRSFVRVRSGPNWTVVTELPLTMDRPSGPEGYGHAALAMDTTGDTIASQVFVPNIDGVEDGPAQVNVFRRTAGVYSQVAELKPGAWRAIANQTTFGLGLAMSGDGATIAVGDSLDNGLGFGPRAAPLNAGTDRTGAVYVWRLRDTWRLANVVKPNYRAPEAELLFGRTAIALNRNGHTLIVGERSEASDAQGIGGDWSDDDAPESGAVWMY